MAADMAADMAAAVVSLDLPSKTTNRQSPSLGGCYADGPPVAPRHRGTRECSRKDDAALCSSGWGTRQPVLVS